MDLETYIDDLHNNEHITVTRDFANVGNPNNAPWRVVAQPRSDAELVFIWIQQKFGVHVLGREYRPDEAEALADAIGRKAVIAATLNKLMKSNE